MCVSNFLSFSNETVLINSNFSANYYIDREKLKDILPSLDRLKSGAKVTLRPEQIGYLDPRWNNLDGEKLPIENIWHLHFTYMNSQPWEPSWNKNIKTKHWRPDLVEYWKHVYNESCTVR